ncbi:hypothetical protein [Cellulosilyticum lentocellum]|uniref:Uncharacterized protein n=1 Tax=Cellulosilyticum lentocellum (strain ATCC 49066 / DSM 5427 / NCIMB 11756 / RHM5) TaxID=642492 RepID=F2JJ46_CELLD|nr:hypothetical protein [Cellulosilyticum lentocellum]ADZ83205.1 hypothetical protein Clole_1479 [Cellulosilyticum lentocellum DSM 5427]
MEGWISLYRKVMDNPIVCKDAEYFSVWVYLLLNATHKEYPAVFKGERITLKPGQLITGRKSISEKFSINESKVQRILKSFENEHQIEQQTGNKNRLISIVRWEEYQKYEHQTELLLNNNWTTSEQQLNTNNNVITKQHNNVNKKESSRFTPPTLDQVREYCLERNNIVDAERFIDFYSSKGWCIGRNKMKDWKAAIRTWERSDNSKGGKQDESRGRNAEEERAMEEHRREKGQWLIDNGYV